MLYSTLLTRSRKMIDQQFIMNVCTYCAAEITNTRKKKERKINTLFKNLRIIIRLQCRVNEKVFQVYNIYIITLRII